MKHCLRDGDFVCTEGSVSAHKIGSENKNLRVFQADITAQHYT